VRRLSLTEWAAVGELVATVGVVISLLFVGFSVRQNTAALQGSMENMLFEQHMDLANHFLADPSLAGILVKMRGEDPQLTAIEAVRWEKYQLNMLDIWTMAFTRRERGLLAEDQWEAWDEYFTELFRSGGEKLSRQRWEELKYGFKDEFWTHVGAALFGGSAAD
jgi:hypothetical protein